jgi:D-glycero-alpha-D-manno-heptose-7-phosphate kinase
MEFYGKNRVIVNPLRIRNWIRCELESSILLHYTGISRSSAEVIDSQIANFAEKNPITLENMHQIKYSALHMKEALLRGNFDAFVKCLNTSWENKKQSAHGVSNPHINETIELAKNAGALGAKISGAGGGGFIMYFIPPEKRNNVINAIKSKGGWVSNCHFSLEGSQCWTIR